MSQTLYASFASPEAAEKAAGALLNRGLRPEDLSVVHRPDAEEPTVAGTGDVPVTPGEEESFEGADDLLTPETKAGAVRGSLIGAGLGAVAVIAALVVPGVGLVIGAGALASALGGIVATAGMGAAAGAFVSHLKEQGVDEDAAGEYDQAVQEGGAVLAVSLQSGGLDEAVIDAVLRENAATNVNRYASRA